MHNRAWLMACGLVLLAALSAAGQKKDEVPNLIKKLQSPFSSDVTAAARALERLGPEGKVAVPALTEALKKASFPDERIAIARALGQMGPAAKDAVPAMGQALKRAAFSHERQAIMKALGGLGPTARPAVPELVEVLRNGFGDDAKTAAEALGQIGPAARDAVPALTQASQSGFGSVRSAAAEALKKIQSVDPTLGVRDHGKFFTTSAVKRINEEINDLQNRYQLPVLVETYSSVPADQAPRVRAMPAAEQARWFDSWAAERLRSAEFSGLYILVCRDPAYVLVVATPKVQNTFDGKTCDQMRDQLVNEFRFQRFDNGLTSAVSSIRTRLVGSGK